MNCSAHISPQPGLRVAWPPWDVEVSRVSQDTSCPLHVSGWI